MVTQQQLEKYLFGAADILRGHIDAADFKQYIFPLVFYKRLSDVWDEEFKEGMELYDDDADYAENEYPHRFKIPQDCHWENIRKTTKNVGGKLQLAFVNIENANPNLRGIFGTFGDTQWTNTQKFSDAEIKDLLEHFSSLNLSTANVSPDIMGAGYEYLIKKFADDGGHTAAEFYTNRTVVNLMTMICDPQPNESIYDPTCGSGGMLIESIMHLKRQNKIYQSLKLYGQEKNIITSSIARINMILHNVSSFDIQQGDTLDEPKILENDQLKKFDVILANPPYSIKKWNRKAWESDAWGRNMYGTPPQNCADYAFQQHVLASLTAIGRCALLWPHGVLFRDSELQMREQMIRDDKVEAIIGLGGNLFYNSSMESCIMVCRNQKSEKTKGKIIFINAVNEIEKIRSTAKLLPQHIERIYNSYKDFKDIPNFAKVATKEQVLANNANLSIPLYVVPEQTEVTHSIHELFTNLTKSNTAFKIGMENLLRELNNAGV